MGRGNTLYANKQMTAWKFQDILPQINGILPPSLIPTYAYSCTSLVFHKRVECPLLMSGCSEEYHLAYWATEEMREEISH